MKTRSAVVYTDLDGCLLDSKYQYQEAIPALQRLKSCEIPLILVSSKTEAEMAPLADELETNAPIVCENGGLVVWRQLQMSGMPERELVGVSRSHILDVLADLRNRFQFRSFKTMGLDGIIEKTGLSEPQAERAAARQTTEPLVWEDVSEKIEPFRQELIQHGLTLTRGGRFWHVAGPVTKGDGVQRVHEALTASSSEQLASVSVGDSPIDTPMLERTETAIVIPAEDGTVKIAPQNPQCIIANSPGPTGWNESILAWIDSLTAEEKE